MPPRLTVWRAWKEPPKPGSPDAAMLALAENTLPFLNGGEPIAWAPHIPTSISLTIIVGILVVTTVASLMKERKDTQNSSS